MRNDEIQDVKRIIKLLESMYEKLHKFLLRYPDTLNETEENTLAEMEVNLLNMIRVYKPNYPQGII